MCEVPVVVLQGGVAVGVYTEGGSHRYWNVSDIPDIAKSKEKMSHWKLTFV